MSVRTLGVLIRQLSKKSALTLALNGGREPFGTTEDLIADLWQLWAGQDHPTRAAVAAKVAAEKRQAKVIELRTRFEQRKQTYGLG